MCPRWYDSTRAYELALIFQVGLKLARTFGCFYSRIDTTDVPQGINDSTGKQEERRHFMHFSSVFAEANRDLFDAVTRIDVAGVRRALRNGANVNCSDDFDVTSPLIEACQRGHEEIIRILLDAGADPWRTNNGGAVSAMLAAVDGGHLSTVEILLNHDNDLLEIENYFGRRPLLAAIGNQQLDIVHLLLDRGANALAISKGDGETTLMVACQRMADLEIVRRLLAAGVPVEALCEYKQTALHHAAGSSRIDVVRELIVEHNANVFAVDKNGKTPFDLVDARYSSAEDSRAFLIECYSNTVNQEHGRLALHAVLKAAEYSIIEEWDFHPPQNPLRICMQLGKLTLNQFRILLSALDTALIHNRDDSGKLPIHMACRNKAPFEVLLILVEMDPTTLQLADKSGALPIHTLCGSRAPTEYASVHFLVELGGVGTLAARNQDGALPLHVLCGSTYPSLRIVQYLIHSVPTSVTVQTNAGQYPFMLAASDTSEASLSVVYALLRANPSVM